MTNNDRYDLSNRLIHFFRKLDLNDGSCPGLPDEWGPGNIYEGQNVISPLFLLRSVIRSCNLWATWSYRNNVRTIYGENPAICFTDMPTAAFLETSRERIRKNQKISIFALTFLKGQLFELGARPVIYGLSVDNAVIPPGMDGRPRIMSTDLLPVREQYRYVTYVPGEIDWTHEREWRLMCRNNDVPMLSNVTDFPGLLLQEPNVSEIGVIVNTKDEAKMVLFDILTLVDKELISKEKFAYILVADDVDELNKLRDNAAEKLLLTRATINISTFLNPQPEDNDLVVAMHALIRKVEKDAAPYVYDRNNHEVGGSWLWIIDNFHPLTRALLRNGELQINSAGKYLFNPYFDDGSSLRHREELIKKTAKRISEEFDGLVVGYFSVLNSDDPNQVPSYNSDFLDNNLFYNYATIEPEL